MYKRYGFTIVELLIVVVVLTVLAAIGIVTYLGAQERAAGVQVRATVNRGAEVLGIHFVRNRDYPPNFAGTEFIPE